MNEASALSMAASWRCAVHFLFGLLEQVQLNDKIGEFYLTDIIALANQKGHKVTYQIADEDEIAGVNDREDLAHLEAILQRRLRRAAIHQGATLIAPDTVFLSADTIIGRDVIIEPHVVIGPETNIGEGSVIKSLAI